MREQHAGRDPLVWLRAVYHLDLVDLWDVFASGLVQIELALLDELPIWKKVGVRPS